MKKRKKNEREFITEDEVTSRKTHGNNYKEKLIEKKKVKRN